MPLLPLLHEHEPEHDGGTEWGASNYVPTTRQSTTILTTYYSLGQVELQKRGIDLLEGGRGVLVPRHLYGVGREYREGGV